MKLAPHMIQSMEILQLPILALQERIEQELNSNPVLEIVEPEIRDQTQTGAEEPRDEADEKDLAAGAETGTTEDIERPDRLDEGLPDYADQGGLFRRRVAADEPDRKLEALKNTAAPLNPCTIICRSSGDWSMPRSR